jgi:hypothetical protein
LRGHIVDRSAHEPRTLDPYVQHYLGYRTALDIGAYNGDSVVILIDCAKYGYSFESGPSNFGKLVDIIAHNRNHTAVADPINLALSDAPGKLPLHDLNLSGAALDMNYNVVMCTTIVLPNGIYHFASSRGIMDYCFFLRHNIML